MPATTPFTRRAALGLASAWPLSACAFSLGDLVTLKGSGQVVQMQPELAPFSALEVSDAMVVELQQGQPPGVLIEGDDNLLPALDLRVQDGVLSVRQQRSFKPTRLRIVVTIWQLESIRVAGSGVVRGGGALVAKRLDLRGGGSGVVNLGALTAERVDIKAGGSTVIKLAGQANAVDIAVGGSGVVEVSGLQARRVSVDGGGSGTAKVWAVDTLNGSVGGSSVLRYRGEPQLNLSKSGAGRFGNL